MAFPTTLTSAVDGVTDVLAAQLNNVEAKIGIDSSAVTTSHDYKLGEVTGSDKAAGKTATQTLTNKTLTSPTITSGALTTPTITTPTLQGNWDGWFEANETWSYASATSFTITGDLTAKYYKGLKIRYKDGGNYEYAHVLSSSYGAPNTTVTVVSNGTYTIANASLTNPAFTYASSPQGFPATFSFSPTWTGFSVDPTGTATFQIQGKICYVNFYVSAYGTSNATGLTMTIPVAATADTAQYLAIGLARDNGTNLDNSTPGEISASGTTVAVYKANASQAWTNANGKGVYIHIWYFI